MPEYNNLLGRGRCRVVDWMVLEVEGLAAGAGAVAGEGRSEGRCRVIILFCQVEGQVVSCDRSVMTNKNGEAKTM